MVLFCFSSIRVDRDKKLSNSGLRIKEDLGTIAVLISLDF